MFCPACGWQLGKTSHNTDWLLCAQCGQMSSMVALNAQGLPRWSALIDIRAEQAKRILRRMTDGYVRQYVARASCGNEQKDNADGK